MKVCYFGTYDPGYPRNKIFINGLRKNGVEVLECNEACKNLFRDFLKFWKAWKLFWRHYKIRNSYDVMVLGYPAYPAIPLARLISRKPIVFDALISIYDTLVLDRKSISKKNPKAFFCFFVDWLCCRLADRILLDTKEHIKFFASTFKIPESKFKKIFVGADNSLFYPRGIVKNTDKFLVHFHGYYRPAQGVKYIIEAAKILENENINFNLLGNQHEYHKMKKLAQSLKLKNVNFLEVFSEKIIPFIAKADVCLGIFGDTLKTKRAIPAKIFEALAMKKPVVTADTPAIREAFENKKDCLLCKVADGHDLAQKILELKNDPALMKTISGGGYDLFKNKFSTEILGKELKDYLLEIQR